MLSFAPPSLFRSALRLLALTFPFASAPSLLASPITYQMLFTSGSYTGSGTLTLASPPASSGAASYTVSGQQIQNLTFTLEGQTYNFSADPSATVDFVNGQISKINFGQALTGTPAGYTLELASGFSLYGSDFSQPIFAGNFTVTPEYADQSQPAAASPTPEPGSLLLLATALLAGAFFLFHGKRTVEP